MEQIHFYGWCFLLILVTALKAKSIWKGVCGGNGVPQPGEFQQYAMVYAVLFYVGDIIFLGKEIDYILFGMLMVYGATGKIQEISAKKIKS